MSEISHSRQVEEVEFVDRHGKKRIRHKVCYVRSAETEAAMENYRLGPFAEDKVTTDSAGLCLMRREQLIVTCPYTVGRALIATKIRQSKKTHKILTGPEVLKNYLDRADEASGSMSLLEGFPQYAHLFLLFSYNEAPNQYLSSLMAQLVGQRYHNRQHVWLLMPRNLASIASQWTQALMDLNYLDQVKVESLLDVRGDKGPEATTALKKQVFNEPGNLPVKDALNDRKFAKKKKKWQD